MEKSKKIRQVLLGVALLGAGAGTAQYAQAQKASKLAHQIAAKHEAVITGKATTRYWINTGSQYEETPNIPDPQNHCSDPSDYQCVLQSDDPSVDSTFPLDDAENQNVSPHQDSKLGQYTP